MPLSDPNLRGLAGNYAAQSAMATLAMMAILLLEDVVLRVAIVEAMASTVFTMFVVPNSVVQPSGGDQRTRDWGSGRLSRRGRHWAPLIVPMVEDSRLLFDSLAALTVGLSITLMVATHAKYPPTAGAALGLVVHGWDLL